MQIWDYLTYMQNHQNYTICISCLIPGRCLELARKEDKSDLESWKEDEMVTQI